MRDRIALIIAIVALALVCGVFGFIAGQSSVHPDNPCGPHTLGVGGDSWYLTAEEILACAECDAPMWSDAWCESCYALWLELR